MFLEVYTCVYRRDQVKKRWKDWSLIFAVQESFHNHLILEWKYFADWYSTSILHIHLKFTLLLPQVLHRIFHNITYNLELNFRGWHYADDTSLYIYSNTHISFLCENADIMRQCFIQVSRVFFQWNIMYEAGKHFWAIFRFNIQSMCDFITCQQAVTILMPLPLLKIKIWISYPINDETIKCRFVS